MTQSYIQKILKNPHTKNLLKLINIFGKIAGYKMNTQKSTVFLDTSNEQFKSEIKKTAF